MCEYQLLSREHTDVNLHSGPSHKFFLLAEIWQTSMTDHSGVIGMFEIVILKHDPGT